MTKKPACLIVDLMHPSIVPMLEDIGFEVRYAPEIEASEVKAVLPEFQGLIVRSKLKITADLLNNAVNLKFVARAGAGVDNVDLPALAARNIALINAPEGNRDAVGEFTLGLLLALFRNIPVANREVKNGQWLREINRGEEISGKTIGIIGYGNMGNAFARRLSGFDCTVLAYDIKEEVESDQFAKIVSLPEIFEQADVVSFHIPYTEANYQLADAAFFSRFKKKIWVLNTARGEIMDYQALISGLESGRIKGAGLDVLENEKLSTLNPQQQQHFNYLANCKNVIVTPHIAGWSFQSYEKINNVLIAKIKDLAEAGSLLL